MRGFAINYFLIFLLILVSNRGVSQSSGLLSFTVDPKMLLEGPYETSKHGELDLTIRLACTQIAYEVGLYTELFPAIGYYSFGIFSNYKILLESNPSKFHRWVLPVGAEIGFIRRVNEKYSHAGLNNDDEMLEFSFGLNASVRYFFIKNMGVELGVNYRYRSDLERIYHDNFQMKYNLFSGIVFVWP